MSKIIDGKITVEARYSTGAYHVAGGGQRASSTNSSAHAVRALGEKLFPDGHTQREIRPNIWVITEVA